jgi:hypothetical protein
MSKKITLISIVIVMVLIIGTIIYMLIPPLMKNRDINGDYYWYFKGKDTPDYLQSEKGVYRFNNGKITFINADGIIEEYLDYEVIDKHEIEFIGKTNGGDIRRERRKIIRDNKGQVEAIYWTDFNLIIGQDVENMYVKKK